MSTTVAASEKVIVPVDKNHLPTAITIRQKGNGKFQWIGNDGHPYSPESNKVEVLSRRAETTGLSKTS